MNNEFELNVRFVVAMNFIQNSMYMVQYAIMKDLMEKKQIMMNFMTDFIVRIIAEKPIAKNVINFSETEKETHLQKQWK